MFQSPEQLARTTKGLTDTEPILETLAADPSLRGELDALSFGVMGGDMQPQGHVQVLVNITSRFLGKMDQLNDLVAIDVGMSDQRSSSC